MAKAVAVAVEKDLVPDAVRKALRAVEAAQRAAYEDVRTSSTVCTDHLDAALKSMQAALEWTAELRREDKADERRSILPPKPKVEVESMQNCHICDIEIEPDDLAICSGCDKATCTKCIGDNEVCKECED
jgi:hypothetical protein